MCCIAEGCSDHAAAFASKPAPTGDLWVAGDPGAAEKLVGVGLLTKAAGQVKNLYLTHCLREQARSHRRFVGWRGSGCSRNTCGSGLAHESGGSGQKSVSDTLPSRASPLPQEICGLAESGCSRKTCGSGLAHESGGSGQKSVSDTLPSQTSPLPQEICGLAGIWVQPKYLWEWACSRKRRVRSKICI